MAGKNGYTTKQFIQAIPGTGGVITTIAARVGCSWQTAKKYVEEYATVKEVYEAECHKITDKARSNVIGAIIADNDLQTSKWWLQVKDPDFAPKQKHEVTGADGGPVVVVNWDDANSD